VVLEVIIDKNGLVDSVRLISGHPLLAPEATENAGLRRYKPILLNGEPVDVVTTITVDFKIQIQ
jgi:protein TonB